MVCSICGSKGVNKSSCPLYVKNPTRKHWLKHPNAKKKGVRESKQTKFFNPYNKKMNIVCDNADKIHNFILKRRATSITLNGKILITFDINLKYPDRFNIVINDLSKLVEFLQLYCDLYKRISDLKPNRLDFFINPDVKTNKLLTMLNSIKIMFIEFLIDNTNDNGGEMCRHLGISLNLPLDQIIETLNANIDLPDINLELMPKQPTTKLKTYKKKKEKKVKIIAS